MVYHFYKHKEDSFMFVKLTGHSESIDLVYECLLLLLTQPQFLLHRATFGDEFGVVV